MRQVFGKLIAVLTLVLSSFLAHSVLIVSPGDQTPLCSDSTISNVASGTYVGCTGAFAGNDSNQQASVAIALDAFSNLFGATGTWGYDPSDKSDSAGNGVFTSNPGTNAGTLMFDNAVEGLFAVALKAGNAYSLFFFEGDNIGISSFDFTTDGVSVNPNNIARALSHASFYSFVPTVEVSAPSILILVSVFAGVFFIRKNK